MDMHRIGLLTKERGINKKKAYSSIRLLTSHSTIFSTFYGVHATRVSLHTR